MTYKMFHLVSIEKANIFYQLKCLKMADNLFTIPNY